MSGTTVNSQAATSAPARRWRIGLIFERFGVPLVLIALIIFFATSPEIGRLFTSPANVHNILANQSVTGLLALGMVVPLVAGYFDLSVPAIAGVANVAAAAMMSTYGLPIWAAITGALVLSLVCGAINATLVAVVRLNPFITTLGSYILLSGVLVWYTGGQVISLGIPPSLGQWGSGSFLGLPRPFWLLIVAAVILWFVLMQTPFGRRLAAIGSNEDAAKLAGIRVSRTIFISYVISGFLGGLAGVLLTIRNGSGDSTSAISYLFPAFAALFLGQTAINPGRPNVWGTIFGVFLIAVAVNGFTYFGAQGWVSNVFNGAALLVAVAISTLTVKARDRRAQAAQYEAIRE